MLTCRPADDRPINRHVIQRLRRDSGALTGEAYLAAAAAVVMLIGLVAGPCLDIDGAWFACLAAMALAASGVLTSERIRSTIDWPFLIFLGVILSMPAMVHHIGVDTELARAIPPMVPWSHGSPVPTLALLFALAIATRIVLSEWVAVPLLTGILVPIAPTLGLDPWVVAFVVLSASNLWIVPYQLAAYRTFCSASEGCLFTHRQVRAFSVAYLLLSLCGLLVSIPLWRLLGLLS